MFFYIDLLRSQILVQVLVLKGNNDDSCNICCGSQEIVEVMNVDISTEMRFVLKLAHQVIYKTEISSSRALLCKETT